MIGIIIVHRAIWKHLYDLVVQFAATVLGEYKGSVKIRTAQLEQRAVFTPIIQPMDNDQSRGEVSGGFALERHELFLACTIEVI